MVLVLGLAPGCATTPADEDALRVSQLDTAPKLEGCNYQDPSMGVGGATSVRFSFIVDKTGSVDPTNIKLLPGRRGLQSLPDGLVSRASSDLLSCSFAPGLIDGQAARVRMEKTFRYPGGA